MNHENQPGTIPHAGPISPTKPIRDYHESLVDKVRGAYEFVRGYLAEFIKSLVKYKADAILLTGRERHSGEPLRVFYFGIGLNLAYLVELLFSEHENAMLAIDVNPFRAQAWCEKHQAGADLVVFDLPWPVCRIVRSNGFVALAPWVNMIIPIAATWEAVMGRWAKNVKSTDLRLIRKHQLTFRTLDTEQAFRHFYHEFHVPYVTMRFGNAVFIEPEDNVVAVHEFGEIIEILREDIVIAAAVLCEVDGSLGFHWTGAPVDIDPPMRDGAFGALYYYITRLAYERGCYEVDCTTSRPTLTDGVLRYKRKWGAMLSGCDEINGQILLKPMQTNQAVTTFLRCNPLITLVDGDFVARVLFDESEVSVEHVLETLDTYFTDGLQFLRLYSLYGFAHGVEDALRERNLPVQLFDLRGIENPLQVYCHA